MKLLLLSAALGIGVAATSAFAGTAEAANRGCTPPLGPVDRQQHSVNLRVANVNCETGRHVALACARFSYGHVGTCSATGYRWRCTSTQAAGLTSTETCISGARLMRITWTD
jgi:hypothetical protein